MRLDIEKLVYGGEGLARLPADDHGPGKAVFVPFVLPGETVEATLSEEKPGFARARLDAIPTVSPRRIIRAVHTFSAVADATISTLTTSISWRSRLPS